MFFVVAVFLVLAIVGDWFTIRYHISREAGKSWQTSGYSCALELLTWAPILVAIEIGNGPRVWAVAAASVIGSGLGTQIAMRRRDVEATSN